MSNSVFTVVEFPVRVKPKLPHGRVHRLIVDQEQMSIATYQDLYGNVESEVLVRIPHCQVRYVRFVHSVARCLCQLSFTDESGQVRSLALCVVDANNVPAPSDTEYLAKLLDNARQGEITWTQSPVVKRLAPPRPLSKFIYGLAMFAGSFIVAGLTFDVTLLVILGVIVLGPSFVALGIDYVRLRTGWHPIVKLIVYVVMFVVVFAFIFTVVGFLDAFDLF